MVDRKWHGVQHTCREAFDFAPQGPQLESLWDCAILCVSIYLWKDAFAMLLIYVCLFHVS